jgi:hypothetical protein
MNILWIFSKDWEFHKTSIGKMCLVGFIYVVENGNQS